MKFGQLLEAKRSAGPAELFDYYLRYDDMKALLRKLPRHEENKDVVQTAISKRLTPSGVLEETAPAAASTQRFVELVEADLAKIGSFVRTQHQALDVRLVHLLEDCKASEKIAPTSLVQGDLDALGKAAYDLDALIVTNYQGFVKIAKKHDRWVGLSLRPWMIYRLSTAAFLYERFDLFVSGLSECYALLRLRGLPPGSDAAVWQPPAEFKRSTTKYWVKPEDALWLKCEIIKETPVLIFGGNQRGPDGMLIPQPLASDASLNMSVYLDNASLNVYHTRLSRKDGATLIRVRWYGANTSPDRIVFVERKTHRAKKKKTGLFSLKERFKLKFSDVAKLLDGTLDLVEVEKLARAEKVATEADVAYALNLATEVRDEIRDRRLVPTLTTFYYRTAFQLQSSNAVRVTLDCQVRMVDETSSRSRLRPGEWYTPADADHMKEVYELPYAVLEVKLQGDTPLWMTSMLSSGRLVESFKFSKYSQGICSLGHMVESVPNWIGIDGVLEPTVFSDTPKEKKKKRKDKKEKEAKVEEEGDVEGGACCDDEDEDEEDAPSTPPRSRGLLLAACAAGTPDNYFGSRPAKFTGSASSDHSNDVKDSTASAASSVAGGEPKGAGSSKSGSGGGGGASTGSGDSGSGDVTLEIYDAGPAADSAVGGYQQGEQPAGKGKKGKKGKKEPAKEPKEVKEKEVKDMREDERRKIDPKTLFANERTMLQWLNMAVLLVFTSLALLATSTVVSNGSNQTQQTKAIAGGAQLCGAILAPAAVLVMVYAIITYYWRMSRITGPDKEARFEDRYGPIFLVTMIIIVCTVAIMISINRFSWAAFAPHHKGAAGSPPGPGHIVVQQANSMQLQAHSNSQISIASQQQADAPSPSVDVVVADPTFGGGKSSMALDSEVPMTVMGVPYNTGVWAICFAIGTILILAVGQCQMALRMWELGGLVKLSERLLAKAKQSNDKGGVVRPPGPENIVHWAKAPQLQPEPAVAKIARTVVRKRGRWEQLAAEIRLQHEVASWVSPKVIGSLSGT